MAEKDSVFSGKIRSKGIFSFDETYRFIYDWLVDNNYQVTESKYTEKITPGGKEIEIKWDATKNVSDYFRFNIQASWRILGMTDVEAQKEGVKVKMNKGDLEIKFVAVLVKDYESRWEDRSIMKFLRGVYDRYIIKGRIDQYEDDIFGEVDELIAQIKAFLALEGKRQV